MSIKRIGILLLLASPVLILPAILVRSGDLWGAQLALMLGVMIFLTSGVVWLFVDDIEKRVGPERTLGMTILIISLGPIGLGAWLAFRPPVRKDP